MEFHLLYNGKLHVNGDRREKHNIRKALHPQLRRLWLTSPNLRTKAERIGLMAQSNEVNSAITSASFPLPSLEVSQEQYIHKGFEAMGEKWNRNGFNFVPLVTKEEALRCSLDILFLRVEEKNYILQGGDIDGRLKTLFDGLRMQLDPNETPPRIVAETHENPFFCLLENDDLISEVRVNSSQLLMLPGATEIDQADVFLQITVRLNATTIGFDSYIV